MACPEDQNQALKKKERKKKKIETDHILTNMKASLIIFTKYMNCYNKNNNNPGQKKKKKYFFFFLLSYYHR